MKKLFTQLRLAALTGLALAASVRVSQAQISYSQDFNSGGSTTNFAGSGSVGSWIYWYNTPGTGGGMTNDVSHDQGGGGTNGGSLYVLNPFLLGTNNPFGYTNGGTQDVFFGTFDNGFGYDFNTKLDMYQASNITFYIQMAPGAVPRQSGGTTNTPATNTDFGSIGVGVINANYGYQQFGSAQIPLAASNTWVQLKVAVDLTQNNLSTIPGIAFDYANYSGYPTDDNENFFIDTLRVTPGQRPPPPKMSPPKVAVGGLNCIASTGGANGQYNREQICTTASTGYTFVGAANPVTYSWTTKAFPSGTGGGGWQQHFFIVGNYPPGQYDAASDYNLPDVFWVTVQQNDVLTTNVWTYGTNNVTNVTITPGTANMNFRLKTNEPGGNGMLFNTLDPTNTNNPHGWPIEPIATLAVPSGAVGAWSVTVTGNTNITISGPGGLSTNFTITAAQAAVFADPCSLILGGQPNVTTAGGDYSVYGNFSASGFANPPINDNFLTDTVLNTNIWRYTDASDTNGIYVVPSTSAYWVGWSLPDTGYILQDKATLGTPGGWAMPTTPLLKINGKDTALVDSSQLPSASAGYFQLLSFTYSQMQVLLGGETNAPGTSLGYTGTATNVSLSADTGQVNVQVNAVDSSFHIIPGIIDTVSITTSADPNSTLPLPAPMVNGTLNTAVLINETGGFTVMAADTDNTNIPSATSSSVTVDP
jgi:hypothetical protein